MRAQQREQVGDNGNASGGRGAVTPQDLIDGRVDEGMQARGT
jgi:hypothetical protein